MTIQPILKQLFACYPHAQVEEPTVAMYLRLISDIPPAELQAVVDQAIAESKFLPTIAELRERHRTLTAPQFAPWEEAWEYTQRMIRECGAANKPNITSNPALKRTVDIIGWRDLCMSDNMAVIRAQFRDIYNGLVNRTTEYERLLPQARQLVDRREHYGLTPIAALLEAKNGH